MKKQQAFPEMNEPPIIAFYLIGLALLLVLSAFFSGSETALFSLSRIQVRRMEKSGRRSGKTASRFLQHPQRLLITILSGNMLVNIASASLVTVLAVRLLGNSGLGVAIVAESLILIIFGEITPKAVAARNPEAFAYRIAIPLRAFEFLIFPFILVLRKITGVFKLLAGLEKDRDRPLTEKEFEAMLEVGEAEGAIQDREKAMVANILKAGSVEVREIMIPRVDIQWISSRATVERALRKGRRTRHSKLPIYYEEDAEHILGIFHLKGYPAWIGHNIEQMTLREFLEYRDSIPDPPRIQLIHPCYFVPESIHVDHLLTEMRKNRTHLAMIVDEYGGTAGMITLDDLLDELLGESITPAGSPEGLYSFSEGSVRVPGEISLRQLSRDLRFPFSGNPEETLAAHVLRLFGRFPQPGEKVRDGDIKLTVGWMIGRRIREVIIQISSETQGKNFRPGKEEG